MNHHPNLENSTLTPELSVLLAALREEDSFDAAQFVKAKASRLNHYMKEAGLSACVVGVSGGIDSALVLALVHAASLQPDSPIKRIVGALLPVFDATATSNQDVATARGAELCQAFGIEPTLIDLSAAHRTTKGIVDSALGITGAGWASGQLVSYQRTPALYYLTSLLTQSGTPAVVVGTTNYDEGAYLGYFAKAADGLVDLQLISELHKSQVFAVSRHLGVPDSILDAKPTGDMYDQRTDEEVFGTSYDFVELFLRAKKAPVRLSRELRQLDLDSRKRYALLASRLEDLHGYNAHKYLAKSPAVHLDLWSCGFPGSWDYRVYSPWGAR